MLTNKNGNDIIRSQKKKAAVKIKLYNYSDQICNYIDSQRSNILEDIAALVEIPSVKGESADGSPFGKYPALALKKALEMCRKSGFAVKNISNAIGFADMNDLPLELGIFAHADVVAAGSGWNSDPFRLTYKDGVIYGRGVSDDKGPAVAALYAMKAIKELGIPLKKNVRLIIGSDEECGSSDLEYYFNSEPTPLYSFSPDAEFPLINTEKGRFAPEFSAHINDNEESTFPRILYFRGGHAANVVPDSATVKIAGADAQSIAEAIRISEQHTQAAFTADYADGIATITAAGKLAHASVPETGNNAVTALLYLLKSIILAHCKSTSLFCSLADMFPHNDTYGRAIGIACEDEISGKLTCSLDMLRFDGKTLTGCFDARTPMCSTKQNTTEPLCRLFDKAGFEIDKLNFSEPHHVSPELPFVKTLLSAYEKYTGQKGECIAIGGGTYVHNIKNGVAFGSIMPGVNTNMHGANESMPFEDIITAAKIYAEVIMLVCG